MVFAGSSGHTILYSVHNSAVWEVWWLEYCGVVEMEGG